MYVIDILLASFNGELFLNDQLGSICDQSNEEWRLIVADDGSSDSTVNFIRKFERLKSKSLLFENNLGPRRGSCRNFEHLLYISSANRIMFCDQDDVWLPNKISKTLAVMEIAEKKYGANTPILVHTDLLVVDDQLRLIAPSLLKYQNLSSRIGSRFNRLLLQNVVTGCTVMINRSLAQLASPFPDGVIMHDWWLALVASLFGQVVYLNEPTVLYRQHSNNSVGAKRWGLSRIISQLQNLRETCESMLQTMYQAQAILDRYSDQLPPHLLTMIEAYARLPYMSKVERISIIFRFRFFRHGTIRTAGFLANLIMLKRQ